MTLKDHNALWYADCAVMRLNGNSYRVDDGTTRYGSGDFL